MLFAVITESEATFHTALVVVLAVLLGIFLVARAARRLQKASHEHEIFMAKLKHDRTSVLGGRPGDNR
jgi:hypothetical protein